MFKLQASGQKMHVFSPSKTHTNILRTACDMLKYLALKSHMAEYNTKPHLYSKCLQKLGKSYTKILQTGWFCSPLPHLPLGPYEPICGSHCSSGISVNPHTWAKFFPGGNVLCESQDIWTKLFVPKKELMALSQVKTLYPSLCMQWPRYYWVDIKV